MKYRRLVIVGVAGLKLGHGILISQRASAVVELVGVSVKRIDGRDIVALSLRLGPS